MPRVLFIRVSAATYDEKEVPKTWPMLYASVWPDKELAGVDSPAKLARKLVPAANRGALELVDAFVDYARYGELADAVKSSLKNEADKFEALRRELDGALGNRDVHKADELCASLEKALDGVENTLRTAVK